MIDTIGDPAGWLMLVAVVVMGWWTLKLGEG